MQVKYNKIPHTLSFRYNSFDELVDLINKSVNNESKWNDLKTDLKKWVETTRKNIIDICYSNNSYLDIILNKSKELI
jgi:hypothetical protein